MSTEPLFTFEVSGFWLLDATTPGQKCSICGIGLWKDAWHLKAQFVEQARKHINVEIVDGKLVCCTICAGMPIEAPTTQ